MNKIKWSRFSLKLFLYLIQIYQIETNLLSNALLMSKVHFPLLGTLISVILRLSTLSYREFSRRKRQVWKKKLHHVSKFTITYPWAKYEGFQFFRPCATFLDVNSVNSDIHSYFCRYIKSL